MARNVFYDIKGSVEEAANLTARSMLMIAIGERIKAQRWTQIEAADALRLTQPRVSDLVNGKLHKFSLDALVNMLPAVGLTFNVHPIGTNPPARLKVSPQKGPKPGKAITKPLRSVAAKKRGLPAVAAADKTNVRKGAVRKTGITYGGKVSQTSRSSTGRGRSR